ncbi:MAG: type II secretion system F family protein [Planctomycetes bacterium]|nr:type II secretion system F family protein [Planctomycetota bacterium]
MTRELAVLVEAKIPLAQGLAGIADTEKNPALQSMLRDVAGSIEAGLPLTEALRSYEHHFGPVYMETLRAAERSGDLVGVMRLLADLLDKIQETKQLLRRAMTYPVIVLCAITLAVSVIVIFVIPKFAATFVSQGVQMPVMTRILQTVGDTIRENWIAMLIGLVTVTSHYGSNCVWIASNLSARLVKLRVLQLKPVLKCPDIPWKWLGHTKVSPALWINFRIPWVSRALNPYALSPQSPLAKRDHWCEPLSRPSTSAFRPTV